MYRSHRRKKHNNDLSGPSEMTVHLCDFRQWVGWGILFEAIATIQRTTVFALSREILQQQTVPRMARGLPEMFCEACTSCREQTKNDQNSCHSQRVYSTLVLDYCMPFRVVRQGLRYLRFKPRRGDWSCRHLAESIV